MNWLLLVGSLAGVLGLAWVARMLELGGATIGGEAEACRLAEQSQTGFVAETAIVAYDGKAALVRGHDGSWMALKVHGAQVAARRLPLPLHIVTTDDGATVSTGERMFGDLRLRLPPEARDKLLTMV